jgi:phosphate transport system ATP-binding protein
MAAIVRTAHLSAYFGAHQAFDDIPVAMEPKQVTALIGPSGCGKSTLLRCLNGMHLSIPGGRTEGQVLLDETNALADIELVDLRRRVGMVFQRPNPFPTMSVYDNVVAGLRPGTRRGRPSSGSTR